MSENVIGILAFLVYSFLAIRWGLRFTNGRWRWLEQPNHKVIKIIISVLLGYILAGAYFIIWIIKLIIQ